MNKIYSLSIFLILTLVLIACGGTEDSSAQQVDPEKLVPSSANFIAKLEVGEILRDIDLESIYEQAPKSADDPQTFEELLDMAVAETGVNLREFEHAIIFGDVTQDDQFVGVLAKGSFESATLVTALQEHGELPLTSQDYKGHEVHVGDTKDGQTLALSFFGEDVAAIGTVAAVNAVIDVKVGDQRAASGKVVDRYASLGDPLFKMALAVPPEALAKFQDEIEGGAFVPVAFESMQDLDVVTIVVDRPGADLLVEANLDFKTAESAEEIGETLIGFLALAKGFAPDSQTQELLQKLDIAIQASNVNIRFQAPLADLKEVASGFNNEASAPY